MRLVTLTFLKTFYFLVILLCAPPSTPRTSLQILKVASVLNMVNEQYVYIAPIYIRETVANWEPWLDTNVTEKDSKMFMNLYRNVLVVRLTFS